MRNCELCPNQSLNRIASFANQIKKRIFDKKNNDIYALLCELITIPKQKVLGTQGVGKN